MSQKTLYSRYTHRRPEYVTSSFDYVSNPLIVASQFDQDFKNPGALQEIPREFRFKNGFRDFQALSLWDRFVALYDLLWGDPNPGTPADGITEDTILTMSRRATYSDWKKALDRCKTQDCVDMIKQAISSVWFASAWGNEPLSSTEYLQLMNYQPSLFWNAYKWYFVGAGVGVTLIMTLGFTAKVLK